MKVSTIYLRNDLFVNSKSAFDNIRRYSYNLLVELLTVEVAIQKSLVNCYQR